MSTTKITKRDMFNKILAVEAIAKDPELSTFLQKEIELLERRKTSKKPTKKQTENEVYKDVIYNYLVNSETGKCIKELQTENVELFTFSTQRLSALLKLLLIENRVTKEYINKTPYYTAVINNNEIEEEENIDDLEEK